MSQPTLAQQARSRMGTLATLGQPEPDALAKAASVNATGQGKTLAAFEPPVLEHLRQSNLAAYEVMLAQLNAAIQDVIGRG